MSISPFHFLWYFLHSLHIVLLLVTCIRVKTTCFLVLLIFGIQRRCASNIIQNCFLFYDLHLKYKGQTFWPTVTLWVTHNFATQNLGNSFWIEWDVRTQHYDFVTLNRISRVNIGQIHYMSNSLAFDGYNSFIEVFIKVDIYLSYLWSISTAPL